MKPVRYGILGTGRMAEKFTNTFRSGLVKDAVLLGAASDGSGRGESFARVHGLSFGYDSYDKLLRNPDVDIVYIANLNDQHDACIRQCLDAGKHILCEKPMFLHTGGARQIIQAARESHLFLMEAMWTRFTPVFAKVKEWIDCGRIGRLSNVSTSLCVTRDPAEYARLYDSARYGGALYDLGIYGIQTAQYFAGGHDLQEIHSISAPAATGVDASTYLHLVYGNGLIAEIKCSIGWNARNEAWLCGDRGYIRIAPFFNFAQQAELYTSPFPAAASLEPAKPAEVFTRESPSGLEYEINHASRCVLDSLLESPVMPLADSLEIACIYDHVLQKFHNRMKEGNE